MTDQLALTVDIAPGHEVTIAERLLGDDRCYVAVCSCGHESAPSLTPEDVRETAHWHAREKS